MSKLLMNKAVVIAMWVLAAWVAFLVVNGKGWSWEYAASATTALVIVLALLVVGLAGAVITALKGKWWLFWLGFLPVSPTHTFGAIRLAMPGSWWYRNRYGDEKRRRADERHAPKPKAALQAAE